MLGVRICLIIVLGAGSISIAAAASQNQSSSAQVVTSNPEAYDAFNKGWKLYRRETPANFRQAAIYFEQAIAIDPEFSRAHAALAAVYWNSAWRSWANALGLSNSQMLDQSRILLKRSMKMPSVLTYQVSSEMAAYFRRKPKMALSEAEIAIALDANDPAGHLAMANALLKAKKPIEGIASMQQAMELDPQYPASYLTRLGRAQFSLGQYAEAEKSLNGSLNFNPQDDRALVYLAATYGHLGRLKEAEAAINNVNKLRFENRWGKLTIEEINRWNWASERLRLKEGLTLAGLESGYDWHNRLIMSEDNIEIKGVTAIDTEQAKKLYEAGVPFIDMSTLHAQEYVPGAHNLRWGRVKEQGPREFNEVRLLEISPKTGEMVIYHPNDGIVMQAASASAYAAEHGFQKVYYLRDGLRGWRQAGYPMVSSN